MKKLITLLLIGLSLSGTAQITEEHTYSDGYVSTFNLDNDGQYYVITNSVNKTASIYNASHGLIKTFPLNIPIGSTILYYPAYLSRKLFDNDNDFELVFSYQDGSLDEAIIINDDGSTVYKISNGTYSSVFKSGNTWKLLQQLSNGLFRIYSLPGQYNGLKKVNEADNTANTELYPNPMDNAATIEYKLPHGVNNAVLKVYNAQGVQMRQYNVTNQFENILIQRGELPAGNYTYELNAANMSKVSRQFVVQ